MRFSFVLLLINLLTVSATVYSQATKFSLDMKNASVEQIFKEVERNSNFTFLYKTGLIDNQKTVSLEIKNATVEVILDKILEGTGVDYRVLENNLVILMESDARALSQILQRITVTGTVSDEYGEPLPGVNVLEKGTTNGVVSDINGQYSIQVAGSDAVLVFSFLGYAKQEIIVGVQNTIQVTMAEDAQQLDEVVVTALGIRRAQKAVGYTTQQLSGNDIVQANAANIASALTGKIAGVLTNSANQLDGGSTRIVIRGNNNIQGNNQPLIIIDGMPLENDIKTNISSGGTSEATAKVRDLGSGLNFINNQDIEDMSVLKGPAAAALYGARGANGVILITTKKGTKRSGVGIDYSFTTKIINPYRYREQQTDFGYGGPHIPMYTADTKYAQDADGNYLYPRMTWGNARWDAIYGIMPSGHMTYDDAAFTWHAYSTSWGPRLDGTMIKWWDGVMRPHVANPDGQEYYYRNGHTNTHNIAFSGGGEFGTVRVGITREDHQAIVHNSDYDRTAVTLGSNLNISKTLKAEIYATYNHFNRNNIFEIGDNNDNFSKYFYTFPTDYLPDLAYEKYKNPDGSRYDFGDTYGQGNNIFWDLYENSYDYKRDQLLGSINVSYSPVEWFTISVRSGLDFHTGDITYKKSPTDILGLQNGYYEHKLNKEVVQNTDIIGTVKKDDLFINRFNASFSLGATRWDRKFYEMKGQTYGTFKDPYLYTFGNYDLTKQSGVIHTDQIPVEDILDKRINSLYGFLDLSYGNFIFAQITGRNDWTSTLPSDNNSYFYPSVSLSFVPTELFTTPLWFNFGKVRLAYAKAANDADPYMVVPTYESSSFGGAPSSSLKNTLPPTNLKPQYANSYELGFNVVMFNYRLNLDFTYYQTRSYNQIMSAPVALSSGYNLYTFNTGELENKGVEIIASYNAVKSTDWDWRIGLNLARNRNKLLSMGDGAQVFEIGQIFGGSGPVIQVEVGDSYGNIYGWDYERNANGDKIIEVVYDKNDPSKVAGTKYKTTANRVKLGNITPDVTGGLNTSLRWKNLSLYGLVSFSFGGEMWSGTYATSLSSGLSPKTLKERNGGGLPYTYPDGTTANHGVKMEGVLEDGTPNNHVVHYIWKYGRLGAWGPGNLTTPSVLDNNWIKMSEITLSYDLPSEIAKKTKVFQNMNIAITGRDLFYFHSSLPDKLNPEALSNSAGNAQGLEFGALPGVRTFSFTVKLGF